MIFIHGKVRWRKLNTTSLEVGMDTFPSTYTSWITFINTLQNQSIAKASECVCDIIQQCAESLLTGIKPAERTDRMYSVCEMRCHHVRNDSPMIGNR